MDYKEKPSDESDDSMESSMTSRGVSRMEMSGMDMRKDKRMMLEKHHQQTLWIYWLIILLGCWMILAPLTFSYSKETVAPSGGREVWLSLAQRITLLKWNDILCGIVFIIFGFRSLLPNRPVSLWICCFAGVWLTFAPIIFWAPSAVIYLNDTFIGMLIIAFTILIPGMPNMILYMEMGADTPPGWTYNPSSWPQRWIMMVTGFLGWVVSRYLAAYQLGYIDEVWDPFFGASSMQVLNSSMSHSLPISDAGLGAIAYTFEFLMGFMGSPARWRSMHWMVTFFGILVIPLGLVHIFLVISQPLLVGHWCSLCILAASIMLPMIPLEVDEVIAMMQYMKQRLGKGEKFWKVFWKGGAVDNGTMDERSPALISFPKQPGKIFDSSIWGMCFPWTLVTSMLIGIILVFLPSLFKIGIQDTPADICHLTGSLIVVVSVISMGEVVRIGRYLNIPLGIIVAISLWFTNSPAFLNLVATVAGLSIAALAIPKGAIKEKYGNWDRYIK